MNLMYITVIIDLEMNWSSGSTERNIMFCMIPETARERFMSRVNISDPKWTTVRSKSTAIKCLIGTCYYLSIPNNVKPALHHKMVLGLTLLRILSKIDKLIHAGIHLRNVGTQFSGITVL